MTKCPAPCLVTHSVQDRVQQDQRLNVRNFFLNEKEDTIRSAKNLTEIGIEDGFRSMSCKQWKIQIRDCALMPNNSRKVTSILIPNKL